MILKVLAFLLFGIFFVWASCWVRKKDDEIYLKDLKDHLNEIKRGHLVVTKKYKNELISEKNRVEKKLKRWK